MSDALPLGDFEWVQKDELNQLKRNWRKMLSLSENSKGYILEVTLEYPTRLHKRHSSFPLAPHHMTINFEKLSPYSKSTWKQIYKSKRDNYTARKLTSTFEPRVKYVVHGANLKYYLKKGLRLVTIHRAFKFTQTKFIKPYIDVCTKMRAAADTKERKDIFKLLCNSLYGKVNRLESCFT